jgi:fatty-acyl-CoA synthase
MMGAVINALNTRLDPSTIAFIIDHGESDVLIVDTEYGGMVRDAVPSIKRQVTIIDVVDDQVLSPSPILSLSFCRICTFR